MKINTIIRRKQGTCTTKKGTIGAEKNLWHITPLLKKGEKVIDLYHSTKSVILQTISQPTLNINI